MIRSSLAAQWFEMAPIALTCLVVAAVLVGCDRRTKPPETRTASVEDQGDQLRGDRAEKPLVGALVAVPQPNLSIIADEIRQQIEARQVELEQLRGRAAVPAGQLATACGQLGMLYHTYRMFDAAEACYRNAHLLAPDVYRWPHYLGFLCRTQQAPEEAIAAFEQALKLRPDAVPTLTYLAEMYLETSQPQRAAELFARALATEPSCATAIVGLGKVAMTQRDYAAAVEHFKKALKLQPRATAIHYSLAMAYRGLGDLDQAKAHLARRGEDASRVADPLIAELPRLRIGARFHENRGLAAGKAGQLEAAIKELRKAVEEDPNVVSTRVNLGTALTLAGQPEAAMEQYRAAIRLKPNFAQAYYNLAVVLGQQGDGQAAIKEFRKATELDPQYFNARLGLAEQLLREGDYRGAAEQYALAVKIDPRHQATRLAEAVSLARAGDYPAARTRLEEARRVLPKSMIVAHGMARLLAAAPDAKVRDGQRAVPLALAVFQTRKSTKHAATVAMAYAEVGQFEEAIRWQKQAVAVAQKSGETDQLPRLRENLAHYVTHQPCRLPWPPEMASHANPPVK
jgi:tetratricopeptide (TPR) repeat protein